MLIQKFEDCDIVEVSDLSETVGGRAGREAQGINNMEQKIRDIIFEIIKNKITVVHGFDFIVEHPADLRMGDYSTNVAMVYFGQSEKVRIKYIVRKLKKVN